MNRPQKKRRGRSFDKTRWLYQKDGRDMGPFSPEEIRELLRSNEINADTPVRESAHTEFHPVREVRAFVQFLEEIRQERARAAKEAELDREVDRVRAKRRAPRAILGMLLLALLAGGGWYGYTLWEGREVASRSGLTEGLYANLDLPELEEQAWMKTAGSVDWADEKIEVRAISDNTPRRKTKGNGGGEPKKTGYTNSHKDLGGCSSGGGVRDLSFGEGGGGRALTTADVNRVSSKATPALVGCAQREANRQPNFPGTTVCFTLMPSGKMGRIRIGKNGAQSGAFVGCVKSALRKLSVASFDPNASGVGRTVRVPLRVGR